MHYTKFCKAMPEMGHSRRIGTPQHKRNVRFASNSVQTLAPQRTAASCQKRTFADKCNVLRALQAPCLGSLNGRDGDRAFRT